jgi:hypothetical protein
LDSHVFHSLSLSHCWLKTCIFSYSHLCLGSDKRGSERNDWLTTFVCVFECVCVRGGDAFLLGERRGCGGVKRGYVSPAVRAGT